MIRSSKRAKHITLRVAAVALLGAFGYAGQAHADVMATLNFSNAQAQQNVSLSGYITYSYNAADTITAINAINIKATYNNPVTAVTPDPGFTFAYGVAGLQNTINTPSVVTNDSTNEVYALQLQSTSDGHIFYPEWVGVSTLAQLILNSPSDAGYSSYGDPAVSNVTQLVSAGSSFGTGVPEPASIALLATGLVGLIVKRRKSA